LIVFLEVATYNNFRPFYPFGMKRHGDLVREGEHDIRDETRRFLP
jgi:hypothetical protein